MSFTRELELGSKLEGSRALCSLMLRPSLAIGPGAMRFGRIPLVIVTWMRMEENKGELRPEPLVIVIITVRTLTTEQVMSVPMAHATREQGDLLHVCKNYRLIRIVS